MLWLLIPGALIVALTVWWLVVPLARAARAGHTAEARHQLMVVRDRLLAQLKELERQAADGIMDAAVVADERRRLEAELAPVLRELEQAAPAPVAPDTEAMPRRRRALWAGALGLSLLMLSGVVYVFNAQTALKYGSATASAVSGGGAAMPPMVMEMVARLEQRLQANPDDPAGWTRLGRAYSVLGRDDDARTAYGKAYALAPTDREILAAYATFLYRADPYATEGLVRKIHEELRRIDPQHPGVLWFFGLAAYQEGRPQEAIANWEQLIGMLPADSPARGEVQKAIDQVRSERNGPGKPAKQ
jgi:cytochrome c-type biogenesis protein CcmH